MIRIHVLSVGCADIKNIIAKNCGADADTCYHGDFREPSSAYSYIEGHEMDAVILKNNGENQAVHEFIAKIHGIDPDIRVGLIHDDSMIFTYNDGIDCPEPRSFSIENGVSVISAYDPFDCVQFCKRYGMDIDGYKAIKPIDDPKPLFEKLPDAIRAHCGRVADMTVKLAALALHDKSFQDEHEYGLRSECMANLYDAALYHDIGKALIDTDILTSKRKTRAERAVCEMHSKFGDKLFEPRRKPLFIDETTTGLTLYRYMIEEVAMAHHACYDGTGEPRGCYDDVCEVWPKLAGIANDYDHAVYEYGMTHEQAVKHLRRGAKTKYNPHVVGLLAEL